MISYERENAQNLVEDFHNAVDESPGINVSEEFDKSEWFALANHMTASSKKDTRTTFSKKVFYEPRMAFRIDFGLI